MKRRAALLFCSLFAVVCAACSAEVDQVPGPKPPPPPPASFAPAATATVAAAPTTPLPPARPPLAELQRAALKGMVAAFNAHDAKKVAALYSSNVVSGSPGPLGWEEELGNSRIE